jgi:hypothetical protein
MIGMLAVLAVAQWIVRIAGVVNLLLGLLFWTGDARQLVPVHMLLGIVLVIALWALAAVSTQQGVPIGLAAGAAIMGIIVLWLGLAQGGLMPGGAHWVIQALHLITGMAAVGMAEAIGGRVRRARLATAAS